MLEKWKKLVDQGKTFGAFLTDLSKSIDCHSYELLIAKLNAYGLHLPALKSIYDYLSNRKQRIKINSSYSAWLLEFFWRSASFNSWAIIVQYIFS